MRVEGPAHVAESAVLPITGSAIYLKFLSD